MIFTCSCKKNEDENGKNPSSKIVFGDVSNMFVRNYDTLIVRDELTFSKSFEIDVDNDNITDFRLSSLNLNGSWLHAGIANGTSINCLHNSASLLSFLETDSLFFNVIVDTIVNSSDVTIHIQYASSCSRIAFDDTIINITENNKILQKDPGEYLSIDERFVSDSITITRAQYSSFPMIINQNPDTTVYANSLYLGNCNLMPNEKVLYFGIRIGDKLGWIKLLIIRDYKILLLESAIEY